MADRPGIGKARPSGLREQLIRMRQQRMAQGAPGATPPRSFSTTQTSPMVNPARRLALMERLRRRLLAKPETRAEQFAREWTPEQKERWQEHQARRLALNRRQQGIAPYGA